jgi:hypothetical protein
MTTIRLNKLKDTIAYLTNIKDNSYQNLDRVRARLSECISAKERIEEKQNLLLLKRKYKCRPRKYNDINIIQYSLKGRKIKEWGNVYELRDYQISRRKSFKISEVIGCCKGVYITRMGYIWKFKE